MKIHEELLQLRKQERRLTSKILTKLQEIEDCKGYLQLGHNSLFTYLAKGLGYSEDTAYQRQACVRLSREIPELKQKVDQGAISISSVATAFKHIRKKSKSEKLEVLKHLEHKSTRQVKAMFQEPAKPIKIKTTQYADKVYIRLEFTPEQSLKLDRHKTLKSHHGGIDKLFLNLIEKELKSFENCQFRPSKSNNPRQISKRLRNSVLKTAGYKCLYPGCESDHLLQIDHMLPVRLGGDQRSENLQVLCAQHNRWKG
jgi:hypothetical protein